MSDCDHSVLNDLPLSRRAAGSLLVKQLGYCF